MSKTTKRCARCRGTGYRREPMIGNVARELKIGKLRVPCRFCGGYGRTGLVRPRRQDPYLHGIAGFGPTDSSRRPSTTEPKGD